MHLVFAFNCRAMTCAVICQTFVSSLCLCVVDKKKIDSETPCFWDPITHNELFYFILVLLVSWHYLCQRRTRERERESVQHNSPILIQNNKCINNHLLGKMIEKLNRIKVDRQIY